jgi:transcriptional regulator GlxA family with amidase domain
LQMHADYDYFNCPSLDYLLIPGGKGAHTQRYHAATLQFIRDFFSHGEYLISVCTGMLILYETGVLKDKQVVTYHLIKEEMKKRADIHILNARYHQDGKIWTSAGISAGLDMILAFIAHVAGDETAGQVQYLAEYYPSEKEYFFHQPAPRYSD